MSDEEKTKEQLLAELEELRREFEDLYREQFLLHNLMGNISDAIYFKDCEGRFLRVSEALAKLFSLENSEQAIGRTDFDFYPKEDAEKFHSDEQRIMREGNSLISECEKGTYPDGSVIWSSTTKMPLRNKDGETIGTFGISRDITERVKLEEERENLIAKLKTALQEVKTLGGLLPICASCKKIRDDEGYWQQVEVYIDKHTNAKFSHGLCPGCSEEMMSKIR